MYTKIFKQIVEIFSQIVEIFRQIVEIFAYSLKEHLLVNLITKECSQWVLGM